MTARQLVVASLVGAAILLGISAGQAQQGTISAAKPAKNATIVYGELEKVPEKARMKKNPLANDPEAPLAGRNLFEQHCNECHGNDADGGSHGPSLRAPEVQNATPGQIFWILTNGIVRHGMPVWSKLPEPQRWQLVSYIKSLGAKPVSAGNAAKP